MASRRRRRAVPGVIPRLGRAVFGGIQYVFSHPQPVLALALCAASAWGVWRLVTVSDAFRVTRVELPAGVEDLTVPELRGVNIWSVNLPALAEALNDQRPEWKWVRVTRLLPTTIRIDVRQRAPVAQVQLGTWHAVDAEGYVFATGAAERLPDLPSLQGAAEPKAPVKAGRVNASTKLGLGVKVVDALRRADALRAHRLTSVDVGDPRRLTFMLDDAVEVRCGSADELDGQLARLGAVLQRLEQQAISVRYVDLRFPDPVIGPNA